MPGAGGSQPRPNKPSQRRTPVRRYDFLIPASINMPLLRSYWLCGLALLLAVTTLATNSKSPLADAAEKLDRGAIRGQLRDVRCG